MVQSELRTSLNLQGEGNSFLSGCNDNAERDIYTFRKNNFNITSHTTSLISEDHQAGL